MSVRMATTLMFILALSALAADVTLGCGQDAYVYGVVQAKFSGAGDNATTSVQIASEVFDVPADFYQKVQVGDLVRYNGKAWTIVTPAPSTYNSQTVPANTQPGQSAPAGTQPAH